ncbi:MAG: preprotein translocase subunit SecE [Solirubrobacteraceae bacterium]|nr:preprotein translocase subunit SecE [Solirubrobacteraceae bacterium]
MARDRQRSKQRRRRSQQGGGNPAGRRARDIGLDDSTIDESGLTDTSPAPDPLKNASPDADQARAAETGAERGAAGEPIDLGADEIFPEGEDDLERAPDAVEESAALTPRRARRGEEDAPVRERRESGNRVIAFLRACIDELRRVQWPDRKHVFQATAVVLGFVLVAGGWLGLMDAIWQPLINSIL